MKKIFATGLMSVMLLGGGLTLHANEMKSPAERQKYMNEKVEKMTKELKLTSEQQASVRAAYQDKMAKMDTLMAETDQKIKASLNPDQAKKYDEMCAKERK